MWLSGFSRKTLTFTDIGKINHQILHEIKVENERKNDESQIWRGIFNYKSKSHRIRLVLFPLQCSILDILVNPETLYVVLQVAALAMKI